MSEPAAKAPAAAASGRKERPDKVRPVGSSASAAIPAGLRRALPPGGRAMPADLRADMEARFGRPFDSVVLHDGHEAAAMASTFRARAYTVGEHVVFGEGRYAPHTQEGRRLLGHELAHVLQQRQGGAAGGSRHEAAADRAAEAAQSGAAGGGIDVGPGSAPGMQCMPMTPEEINRATEQELRARLQENEQEYGRMVGNDQYYRDLENEAQLLHKAIYMHRRLPQWSTPAGKTQAAPAGPAQAAEPEQEQKFVLVQPVLDPEERAFQERRNREQHQQLWLMSPGFADFMMKQPGYAQSMGIYYEDPAQHPAQAVPAPSEGVHAPMILDLGQLGRAGKAEIGGSPEYWNSPRGKARRKLQDELQGLESRQTRMSGIYKDVVEGSIVIRNVIEAMGGKEPPSAARLNKAFSLLREAQKGIDSDRLEEAAKQLAEVGAIMREFEWYWNSYTDYLEVGGRRTIQSLEMVRDASKYSLIVLSAGGGAAVAATGALGTLAINTTEAATNAALGEKVDWTRFALQAAIDLLLAKYGGTIARGFVARLVKLPGFAKLGESALLPLVRTLLSGAEARAAYATFDGLYKGDMTWGQLMDAVFDPTGILFDVVLHGVSAKLQKPGSGKPDAAPGQGAGKQAQDAPPPKVRIDVSGTPADATAGAPARGGKLPAANRGVPDDVIDDVLAELNKEQPFKLGVGQKRAAQIESGERDFALDQPTGFHVDEPLAVGAPGVKPQRKVQRAMDPHNRQLLDPATNVTKHVHTDPATIARGRQRLPPVSVTQDPAAVFTRRFDEVVELNAVFNQAVARVGNLRGLSPTVIKARINANIRDIIQNGRSVEGLMVRDAMAAHGFEFVPGRGIVQTRPTASGSRVRVDIGQGTAGGPRIDAGPHAAPPPKRVRIATDADAEAEAAAIEDDRPPPARKRREP